MELYNTASSSKQQLDLGHEVSLYVCGITPYAATHLGHAFTYHTFDVLTRMLQHDGHTVRSVRNITDVDDDIFRVSRERNVSVDSLVASEMEIFHADCHALNMSPVTYEPYASEAIEAMIARVAELVACSAAYVVDGTVYFSVDAFPRYGQVSHYDTPTMISLSRERGANPDDPNKRNPLDFILWQPEGPGEKSWDAPWSRGRPGWHIECSTLAETLLGLPVDIHGGGEDLIYPHHESEAAQAEACRPAVSFVRYWAHVSHVGYEGEKMSKSLGNLVFARDLRARKGARAVRYFLSQFHYRTSWEYEAAQFEEITDEFRRLDELCNGDIRISQHEANELTANVKAHLRDDLDTVSASKEIAGRIDRSHASVGAEGLSLRGVVDSLWELFGIAPTSVPVIPAQETGVHGSDT
ncbi:MAG: class I tRNA ligase family protein [Candidatus Dormibacteria bacterium]